MRNTKKSKNSVKTTTDPSYHESCFTHTVAPYGSKVTVVISSDILKSSQKRKSAKGALLDDNMIAFTITLTTGWVYVMLREDVSPETIVHESFHAIHSILEFHKIAFDEEIYAYHLDDLFSVISKFVERHRAKYPVCFTIK